MSLWINNDEGLYHEAKRCIREEGTKEAAAETMLWLLESRGVTHTPDGAPYSKTTIRAAMVEM